jgi:hypothetical protein
MMFLLDNPQGQSRHLEFTGWEAAEGFASRFGWTLVGEFVEEQPGPDWLMDTPETMQ